MDRVKIGHEYTAANGETRIATAWRNKLIDQHEWDGMGSCTFRDTELAIIETNHPDGPRSGVCTVADFIAWATKPLTVDDISVPLVQVWLRLLLAGDINRFDNDITIRVGGDGAPGPLTVGQLRDVVARAPVDAQISVGTKHVEKIGYALSTDGVFVLVVLRTDDGTEPQSKRLYDILCDIPDQSARVYMALGDKDWPPHPFPVIFAATGEIADGIDLQMGPHTKADPVEFLYRHVLGASKFSDTPVETDMAGRLPSGWVDTDPRSTEAWAASNGNPHEGKPAKDSTPVDFGRMYVVGNETRIPMYGRTATYGEVIVPAFTAGLVSDDTTVTYSDGVDAVQSCTVAEFREWLRSAPAREHADEVLEQWRVPGGGMPDLDDTPFVRACAEVVGRLATEAVEAVEASPGWDDSPPDVRDLMTSTHPQCVRAANIGAALFAVVHELHNGGDL